MLVICLALTFPEHSLADYSSGAMSQYSLLSDGQQGKGMSFVAANEMDFTEISEVKDSNDVTVWVGTRKARLKDIRHLASNVDASLFNDIQNRDKPLVATRKMDFTEGYGMPKDFNNIAVTDTKKALKILKKLAAKHNRDANYQLAHYYLFGALDLYACNLDESPVNYAETSLIDERKGLEYLKNADPWFAAMLYANKDCKYYHPAQAFICMVKAPVTEETDSIMTIFLQREMDLDIDLRLLAQSYYKECVYSPKNKKRGCRVWKYSGIEGFDRICRVRNLMPPAHCSAIRNLKNHTPSELFAAGLSCEKKGDKGLALYFYRLAALSGSLDAFKATYNMYYGLVLGRSVEMDYKTVLESKKWQAEEMACAVRNDAVFEKLYPKECKELGDYWWELSCDLWDQETDKKEAKKQARREMFGNILAGLGQGLMMATGAAANASMGYNPYNYSNIANTNGLLNPGYGIMQTYYPNMSNGMVTQDDYNAASSQVMNYMDSKMAEFNQQWNSVPLSMQIDWSQVNWNTTYNSVPVGTPVSVPSGDGGVISSNDYNSSPSSTPSSGSHECSYCKGKGRVPHESLVPLYGTPDSKKYCSECGQYFLQSCGHSHITCPVCHGRK